MVGALSTFSANSRVWTYDFFLVGKALSQLSYVGITEFLALYHLYLVRIMTSSSELLRLQSYKRFPFPAPEANTYENS